MWVEVAVVVEWREEGSVCFFRLKIEEEEEEVEVDECLERRGGGSEEGFEVWRCRKKCDCWWY